jgi:O-succinylhomoserine sulfhydrylase
MDGAIPKKKAKADQSTWRPQTRAVRGGQLRSNFDETSEALYLTSGYAYSSAEEAEATFKGESTHYQYSRFGNPTVSMFENRLAALEGAEACRATSTGMSAVFFTLLALLKSGDRIVAARQLFGSCHYIVADLLPKYGIQGEFVDGGDLAQWERALSKPAQAVLFESPSNPMLDIVDIKAVCDLAHKAGAKVVLDNAFATPILQRPLELGADLVMHSLTKSLGGHSDLIGGALVGSKERIDRARDLLKVLGGCLDPHAAALALRGLKTLHLRVERHCANAMALARHLESHPKVARVLYPGLASHPGHDLARRQMSAFGGIVAFVLAGGLPAAERFYDGLRLVARAASLGGVETLVSLPVHTSHHGYTDEQLRAAGVDPGMVRVSLGVEDAADVIADIDQALETV